ncbi:MAG: hypothetical protein EA378_07025 [Phycisphaerales bacterium]|nr:MAG: hypothetical protein EA378_07025 [Phycisphaerales bacterium]
MARQIGRRGRRIGAAHAAPLWLASLACVLGAAPWSFGQADNPVYVDETPRAGDALARVPALVEAGNVAEAVRALQAMLDESAERLIATDADPSLYLAVRTRVHAALLADRELLDRYRQVEGASAARALEAGEAGEVERRHLLTPAGFDAALRVAQLEMESASFDAARMTLRQLDRHPDRTPGSVRARSAARLATTLTRYTDDAPLRALAERWRAEGGLEDTAAPARVEHPPASRTLATSPLTVNSPLDTPDLLASAMSSVPTSPAGTDEVLEGRTERERQAMREATSWVFPTVVGDVVYVNDGRTVSAWDRFTLEPIWRAEPEPLTRGEIANERDLGNLTNFRPGGPRPPGDSNTVTIAGALALAATGISYNEGRDGDPRVHAIDTRTGRVLWSRAIASASPELVYAVPRGPIVVSGDTAIVVARKFVQARRLVSTYLVGLDLWTGETRWVRLAASTGAMPFSSGTRATPAPVLDRGVVYHADDTGVIIALAADTGRPIWVRRFVAETTRRGVSSPPFTVSAPVVVGDRLYALTPNLEQIVEIHTETGELLGERPAATMAMPEYILRVGDHLAGVSADRAAFVPINDVTHGVVTLTAGLLRGRTVAGRAVAAGDELMIPMTDGLLLIDPGAPGSPSFTPLEHAGNALAADGQLLVAGPTSLRSHPIWSSASSQLEARLDRDPGDPAPAVTLAQLAFRAGRHDRIIPAVDRALAAIEGDPLSPAMSVARTRLHDALMLMIHAGDAPDPGEASIRDLRLMASIVDRAGRTADTPEQRVAHLFALGRQREAEGRPALAVEAYQRVLRESPLRSATWRGLRLRVRADAEAARRVRELVRAHGPTTYAAFDAEAALEAAAMGPETSAGAIERLALRYPASATTSGLWLRAASAHDRAGRPRSADAARARAFEAAELDAAIARPGARDALRDAALERLAALDAQARLADAAGLLRVLERDHPELDFAAGAALLERIRVAGGGSGPRLAWIGPSVTSDIQRLEGWRLRPPIAGQRYGLPTDRVVMQNTDEPAIGLFRVGPGGELEPAWSVHHPADAEPVVVRHDEGGVLLFHPLLEGGGRFERLDAASGQRRWITPPFHELFPPDPGVEARIAGLDGPRMVQTPMSGLGTLRDVLIADIPDELVAVERSGRVAAIDLRTGRARWTATTHVERVYDVDVGGGVVALIGETLGDDRAQTGQPRFAAIELESGRGLRRDDLQGARPRWVRVARDGQIIIGATGGVLALGTDGITWSQNDAALIRTVGAWVVGPSVYIRDEQHQLRRLERESGRLVAQPLPVDRRLDVRDGLRALIHDDTLELLTPRGIIAADADGELLGLDGLETFDLLTTPAATRDYYAAIDRRGIERGDGAREHALYIFHRPDGRLAAAHATVILTRRPTELAAIDGRLLLTAGNDTIVLQAPIPDPPPVAGPSKPEPRPEPQLEAGPETGPETGPDLLPESEPQSRPAPPCCPRASRRAAPPPPTRPPSLPPTPRPPARRTARPIADLSPPRLAPGGGRGQDLPPMLPDDRPIARPRGLAAPFACLRAPWLDTEAAQRAFDRQHARDELGTRLHLILAGAFALCLGAFISAMEIALAALALYWLVRANNTWRTWPALLLQPAMLILALAFAWLAISLLWSPDRAQGWRELGQARFAVVPLLLWPVLDRKGWIVAAMLVGFALGHLSQLAHAVGLALELPALTFNRQPGRNSGWWDPAVSGTLLMVPLGMHGAALAAGRGRWRALGAVGFAITWIALLATGTRGGWLAGAGLTLVVGALALWHARRVAPLSVLAVLGALGLVVVTVASTLLAPTVLARAEAARDEVRAAVAEQDYDTDTGKRVFMVLWAGETFAAHPVLGLGAGSFREASARAMRAAGHDPSTTVLHDHAHHTLLHVGATTGTVGLLLALALVAAVARGAIAPRHGPKAVARPWRERLLAHGVYTELGPALALVGLALVSAFDTVHINAQTAAIGATCLALATVWCPHPATTRSA